MVEQINSRPEHNLPVSLSSFVGRRQEIAEVNSLLAKHRLVTLTGPGGCGKTRLALEVAGELRERYPGGIWLVELAPLASDSLVAQAAADALGLREEAGQSATDLLVSYLRPRSVLLLLDNCEHLIDACADLITALLKACADLKVLATSREPLAVAGEAVWVVPPLTLPEPLPWRSPSHRQESLAAYSHSEAVQLFITRAAAASPGFALTEASGPHVAEICRQLDGLPLAIELAAARLRAYSVQQIAARLEDRFHMLKSRLRTAPARQQTLTATLDWSYELLSDQEQKLLQRLAVFADGWTLTAAEEIGSGELIPKQAIMDLLAGLVDKSLVVAADAGGRRRFHLLETIRQYALQKLSESGRMAMVRDRHLAYFCDWAERAAEWLTGPEQTERVARFEAEHDNLRAAFDWSQTAGQRARLGLRLARACGYFWRLRGNLTEGQERLLQALSWDATQARDEVRAWALLWAAHLAYLQSEYEATVARAEQALAICLELGPAGKSGEARAHDLLGEVATEIGDYESAPGHFEKALAIYRELDHMRGIADMLMQLAWAAMRVGNYAEAAPLFHECLTLYRELDDAFLLGIGLAGLGELAVRQGRYEAAERLLRESLDVRRALGERWGVAVSLGSLAWLALQRRELPQMRSLLAQSLNIRIELGDQGGIAWCLEKAAEALAFECESLPASHRRPVAQRAVRLYGAAAALRAPLNSIIDPADQPAYEQCLSALHRTLDPGAFAAFWDEGAALPLDAAVELALAPPPAERLDDSLSPEESAKAKFAGLSPRERQTAALIAQGKSNRAIAEIMVVREKTIETYVTRILNKLGFDSRVQIATWAVTTGLVAPNEDAM